MNKMVSRFLEITASALQETDGDRFIDLCLQRLELSEQIKEVDLDVGEVKMALLMEEELLRRLETERRRVIEQIDELSMRAKAARMYRPRFPIPPMPFFFESTT